MLILAGLGNPGPKYADNRHNIGFMAADAIVRRHNLPAWRRRFQADATEGVLGGEKVLILKPQTFMNESGRSLGEAARFFKVAPERVFVVYDELDLKSGKIRVKWGGGNGGHNGIRSTEAHLGKNFCRVRLGIGHPGDKEKVLGHVLGDFAKADRSWLDPLLDAIADHVGDLVSGSENRFMSAVSQAVFPPPPKPAKTAATPKDGQDTGKPTAASPDRPSEPDTSPFSILKRLKK